MRMKFRSNQSAFSKSIIRFFVAIYQDIPDCGCLQSSLIIKTRMLKIYHVNNRKTGFQAATGNRAL
jgi:hypothetical protein